MPFPRLDTYIHYVKARPVYLMLPTDLVHESIPAKRLQTPLNLSPPQNDPEVEEFVLDEIIKLVNEAEQDVVILVDACAVRHGVKKELEELVAKTGFPVYAAPMGKTAVEETYERYGGVSVPPESHSTGSLIYKILYTRSMSEQSVDLKSRRRLRTQD